MTSFTRQSSVQPFITPQSSGTFYRYILVFKFHQISFEWLDQIYTRHSPPPAYLTADDKRQLQQITNITDHLQTSQREPANMYPNRFMSLILD